MLATLAHNITIMVFYERVIRPYGYLMNIRELLRFALYKWPGVENTLRNRPFGDWYFKILDTVVHEIGKVVGIPDLSMESIWLGNGFPALCWSLPDRFDKFSINQNPELRKQVDNLRNCLGEESDPKYFHSFEYLEPEHLKRKNLTAEDVDIFDVGYFIDLFNGDRKAAVEQLKEEMREDFQEELMHEQMNGA